MKQEIKQDLLKLQDKKYKEFHRGLCPKTDNIIGIRVPILRNYAKELIKKYPFEILIENIDNEYYEEIMLQGMLIAISKLEYKDIIRYIERYIPKIDNWAICDVFCAGLKITKKHKKEMWEFINKYTKSNNEFEVRFSIVMMLDYYIEEEYIDKLFKIFDNVKNSKYYVQMAVAWNISICLIKFYDKTLAYLDCCKLDKFTYNKALQKAIESYRINKGQKEYLKSKKIK